MRIVALILSVAVSAAATSEKGAEYSVTIPEEEFVLFQFRGDDLPGVAVVNTALVDFEPKVVFPWHLAIVVQAQNLGLNRMPTREEQQILYEFEDTLSPRITAGGNALFLGRVTWNGVRELYYRVYDPEVVHQLLQSVIAAEDHLRAFEYRMEGDETWEKAAWLLSNGGT